MSGQLEPAGRRRGGPEDRMEERRLLTRLCLLPPGPVPGERLERLLMPHAGRAEVRAMLNRQLDAGHVRLVRNVSGDTLVCLVPESMAELHRSLFGPFPVTRGPVRQWCRETVTDLVFDMVILLGLVADGQPKLARKGGLAKRTGESWSRRMSLTEEAGRRISAGKRAMISVPDNVAVVLDLLLRAGLVAFRDGRLAPEVPAIAGWMGQGDQKMRQDAYFLWLHAFPPAHPLARHAAWLLPSVPQDAWVVCAELEQTWRERLAAFGLDDGNAEGWIDELIPLQEAGWLAFGETEDGAAAFRPALPLSGEDKGGGRPDGLTGGPLYVQPDFELLLPFSGSYALHGLLEGFADLVAGDRMNVYRLTERSVKRAYSRGWTAETLLDVLAAAAAGEVPEEVVRGIRDWEKQVRRFQAAPAVLLQFSDAETAEHYAALEAFGPLLREDNRLSPGVFVLREAEWTAFREAAERAGEETTEIRWPAGGGQVGKGTGQGEVERAGGAAGGCGDSGPVGEAGPDGVEAGSPLTDFRLAVVKAIFSTLAHKPESANPDIANLPGGDGDSDEWTHGAPVTAVPSSLRGTDGRTDAETHGATAAGTRCGLHGPCTSAGRSPKPLPGLFPSPFCLDGYRPAEKWQPGELFPGYREVPAAWWKERCGGHPTTKLRLLRLAMEWGCRVEAELTAGRRTENSQSGTNQSAFQPSGVRRRSDSPTSPRLVFLVTELAEDEAGWRIGGYGEEGIVRLRLSEVENLRLVLPGLSKNNT